MINNVIFLNPFKLFSISFFAKFLLLVEIIPPSPVVMILFACKLKTDVTLLKDPM